MTLTALAQALIYKQERLSVALLADLIHNFGDALTAIPLGIAFFLQSARGRALEPALAVVAGDLHQRPESPPSVRPSSASSTRSTLSGIFELLAASGP